MPAVKDLNPNIPSGWVTIAEASRKADLSAITVRRMINTSVIEAHTVDGKHYVSLDAVREAAKQIPNLR